MRRTAGCIFFYVVYVISQKAGKYFFPELLVFDLLHQFGIVLHIIAKN
jgi:hypothetical protein